MSVEYGECGKISYCEEGNLSTVIEALCGVRYRAIISHRAD